jgi:hypothetical protein
MSVCVRSVAAIVLLTGLCGIGVVPHAGAEGGIAVGGTAVVATTEGDVLALRAGPGVGFPSRGLLPRGTPLAATGEAAYAGGFLWRRFTLADGRSGWVRDIDVLPVP